jgi:hypothetical protein
MMRYSSCGHIISLFLSPTTHFSELLIGNVIISLFLSQGGSDTTWSQHSSTKGRGHLWSALLVFMVCIVTLAVLAVVGLALVLGGNYYIILMHAS